jgi:hypothetical protein
MPNREAVMDGIEFRTLDGEREVVEGARLQELGGRARGLFETMQPHGTGKTNLNFPGLGDEPEFVRAAFGDHWRRLVEVKRRYDPGNLFRVNQNIDPND